ncbi:MAG: DNA polymerase III subunit gamma/tau [Ignavibacteria bacterium]|nr:DNA polymerase III subunit gamma/tau [Bacteroidota bacterium]MSQ45741.1 DNA polymerase III subunit gamma/tau [Ignavibacteria bacterium]
MSYIVTARKYRPQIFEDVVGQQHITTTLRNAIASNRLSHAYIFSGGRGSGKTTTARILAKAVNCTSQQNFNPCNNCDTCKEITDGRSLDVIEIDGASNRSVEEIQKIREGVKYMPTRGKYRVYIIDEVHMLTQHAFNALLKTLEEPPSHIVFIFATTEIQKVPTTILSRCQRYDFRRISVDDIVMKLEQIAKEEKISIDKPSLLILAKKADGAMRDAQSMFDQVISSCGSTITSDQVVLTLNLIDTEMFFRVSEAIAQRNTSEVLTLIDDVMQKGYDLKEFVSGLIEHFRNMLIIHSNASPSLLAVSDFFRKKYQEESKIFSEFDILRVIQLLGKLETGLKYAVQPRFRLEAVFVQMTKLESVSDISTILAELQELKKKPFFERLKSSTEVIQQNSIPKTVFPATIISKEIKEEVQPVVKNSFQSEVTIEFLKEKWVDVVTEANKRKVSTGSILSHVIPFAISDGALQLGCEELFHISAIKKDREFISGLLKEIFNINLRAEGIIQEKKIPQIINTHENGMKKEEVDPREKIILDILYTKFGAEPI